MIPPGVLDDRVPKQDLPGIGIDIYIVPGKWLCSINIEFIGQSQIDLPRRIVVDKYQFPFGRNLLKRSDFFRRIGQALYKFPGVGGGANEVQGLLEGIGFTQACCGRDVGSKGVLFGRKGLYVAVLYNRLEDSMFHFYAVGVLLKLVDFQAVGGKGAFGRKGGFFAGFQDFGQKAGSFTD